MPVPVITDNAAILYFIVRPDIGKAVECGNTAGTDAGLSDVPAGKGNHGLPPV